MKMKNVVPLLSLGLVAVATAAVRQGTVSAEVAIGKSVASSMPVDTASAFPADVGTLVCWTRVTGAAADSKITHVWIHGADTVKVELKVGGSPWRTYSRKSIGADQKGDWSCVVTDEKGATLATKTFKIG
jgi:DUF2914 family protein